MRGTPDAGDAAVGRLAAYTTAAAASGMRLLQLLLLLRLPRVGSQTAASCPEQCAPGTEPAAASQQGGSACASCPAGRVSFGGSHACMACPAGTVPVAGQGACVQCDAGARPAAPLNQTCEPCPAGRYSNSHTHGACHDCGHGTVPSAQQDYCTRCVAGEHANAMRSACESCPPGHVSGTTQAECHACAAGQITNREQSECELCPPGKEAAAVAESATGSDECRNCTAGRYSTHDSMCQLCPIGHVPAVHADYCTRCVAGEQPNPNGTACVRCAPGSVSATTQAGCASCPAGKIPNQEQAECVSCPPGCEASGGTGCRPCVPGSYSTLLGSCHTCQAGHVPHVCEAGPSTPSCTAPNSSMQQSMCEPAGSCDRCDAGKAPNAAGTRCEACPLGTVALSGAHHCQACPAGKISSPLQGSCETCPRGLAPHLTEVWRCEACVPGRTANPGDSACTTCPSGHHSTTHGSDCAACLGRTEPNLEQTGCVCKADHFNASLYEDMYPAVSPGCVPCDARTLGEITERVVCPGGLYQPGGEARLYAFPGFWIGDWKIRDDRDITELATDDRKETEDLHTELGFDVAAVARISAFVYYCSSPVICPGFTLSGRQQHRPDIRAMNMSKVGTNMNLTVMTALCEAQDGQIMGQCIRGAVCAENQEGVLCGTCRSLQGVQMRKLFNQRCAVCTGSNTLYVLTLVFGWAGFALFLDFKARQIHVHEDGAALGILTFFFQSLALFADRKGDNAIYGLARLLNMDFLSAGETDDGTPECLLDIGTVGAWFINAMVRPACSGRVLSSGSPTQCNNANDVRCLLTVGASLFVLLLGDGAEAP